MPSGSSWKRATQRDKLEERRVYALLKFGKKEHIEDLRCTGNLYMRTLDYFLCVDDQQVRGDGDEGLSLFLQPERVKVTIGGILIPSQEMAGPVKVAHNYTRACHVFCMHAVTDRRLEHVGMDGDPVDPRNLAFGDHALVLTNLGAFISRLKRAAAKAETNAVASLVRYVSASHHHGEMSALDKLDAYAWQSEYRIVVEPTGHEITNLSLGSLADISIVVHSAELNRNMRFSADR